MPSEDTIVAVATPAGYAARAVVRMSGPDALACARARFRPDEPAAGQPAGADWSATFRATPGAFRLLGEDVCAPALVYVMRAPHSYTREDVVEVHAAGSPALLDLVLDDLLAAGPGALRLAEPGEFTRRAFLNGRIDLAQAESVLAVIRSAGEAELLAAVDRLRGGAGQRCAELLDAVTELRVAVESALDFAPHGIEPAPEAEFLRRCEALERELLAEVARGRGEAASDGAVHVVICGRPNVGKSSLLNRLAREERALVHETPGTTRDAVEAEVELAGVFFRLTDTPGLHDSPTVAQAAGNADAEAVRRARERIAAAQLLLVVLDGSRPAPPDALEPARLLPPSRVVVVVNKCDLPQALDETALAAAGAHAVVHTSALTGEGIGALEDALWRSVAEGRLDASAADCLFNARQRAALRRAAVEVAAAARAVEEGMGYEFAAFNLREAAVALGEVTGEVPDQDVLDRIFSRFCIGK